IETPLSKNLEVYITRVSETIFTENVVLDFKTLKREDPNLERGKIKVVSAGKKGLKARTYKIKRENGKEVLRRLIEEKIIVSPQDEVIGYGTKKTITVSCRYNNLVLEAANKYNIEPNDLCALMMKESNGNPDSVGFWGEPTYGLFQYKMGFWQFASTQAGFSGISWKNPRAQIFSTAWSFAHGYRNRWP
ncbi:MAG: G5 domain-containing protein, partial [Candidatus Omnitrophica bacterium]|nr:G5 domain-containing protein [Candidatus Omnitrophota bacterium]